MTGLNSMIGFVFVIRYTSKLSNGVKFQPLGLFLMLEGLKFLTLGGCRYKYYVWKNVEESALAKCLPLLNWIRQKIPTSFNNVSTSHKKKHRHVWRSSSRWPFTEHPKRLSPPPRCISRKWECPSSWDDHNQMTTWKIIPVSKYT